MSALASEPSGRDVPHAGCRLLGSQIFLKMASPSWMKKKSMVKTFEAVELARYHAIMKRNDSEAS